MSSLKLSTIQNLAGTASVSSDAVISGSAKAWVNVNASSGTPIIKASYNVSSLTDNNVGDYTINFINALPDANYSVATSVVGLNYNDLYQVIVVAGSSRVPVLKTTTQIRINTGGSYGTGMHDLAESSVTIFR